MKFFESIGTISIFLSKRAEAGFPGRHGTTDENNLSERKLRELACDPKNPIFDFGEDDHLYDKNSLLVGPDFLEVECKYVRKYYAELTCEDGTYKAADPDDCAACDPKNPSFDFGDDAHYYDTSGYEYNDWGHTVKCSLIPTASANLFCDADGKLKPDYDKCEACDPKNPSFDFGDDADYYITSSYEYKDSDHTVKCSLLPDASADLFCDADGKLKPYENECEVACDPKNPSFDFGHLGDYYDTTSYEYKDGKFKIKCSYIPNKIELICEDRTLKPNEYICEDFPRYYQPIMKLYDGSNDTISMEKFTDIQKFALAKRGDKMMEAIAKADQNGDGQIDIREFWDHTHEMHNEEWRKSLFKLRDTNNDQALDNKEFNELNLFDGFQKAMDENDENEDGKLSHEEAKEMKKHFHLTDSDNDGFYSYEEARLIPVEWDENGFPQQGTSISRCSRAIFNFYDQNGDKKVSSAEYISSYSGCLKTEEDWVDANGNDCAKYRAAGWCSKYDLQQKSCVMKDNCHADNLCCPQD